jgi:hypothetical protein
MTPRTPPAETIHHQAAAPAIPAGASAEAYADAHEDAGAASAGDGAAGPERQAPGGVGAQADVRAAFGTGGSEADATLARGVGETGARAGAAALEHPEPGGADALAGGQGAAGEAGGPGAEVGSGERDATHAWGVGEAAEEPSRERTASMYETAVVPPEAPGGDAHADVRAAFGDGRPEPDPGGRAEWPTVEWPAGRTREGGDAGAHAATHPADEQPPGAQPVEAVRVRVALPAAPVRDPNASAGEQQPAGSRTAGPSPDSGDTRAPAGARRAGEGREARACACVDEQPPGAQPAAAEPARIEWPAGLARGANVSTDGQQAPGMRAADAAEGMRGPGPSTGRRPGGETAGRSRGGPAADVAAPAGDRPAGAAEGKGGPAPAPGEGKGASGRAGAGAVRRRGPADPVRGVMHRHQALLDGAVDVWEITAGLEAQGLTDADARRLRHRDVFGLAEEMYARAPRARRPYRPAPAPDGGPRAWPGWRTAALHLLPAAACAAPYRPAAALLLVLAAAAVTRRGPLRAATGAGVLWAAALLALTLPGLGRAALAGLAVSLVPAAYAARWFAVRARAQLAPSHGLSDFADAVRPRLAAVLAGYAAALLALVAADPLPLALGVLLFTARLLAVHGRAAPAAAGLAAACAAQAVAVPAAQLGVTAAGAPTQALICAATALALTVQAFRLLPRASAHHPA